MAWINLIADDNSRGLSWDIQLLRQTLTALGHRVEVTGFESGRHRERVLGLARRAKLQWRALREGTPRRYDLNLMLEHVSPSHFRLAKKNVLIPNPEWLRKRDCRWLARFDAVFAKTDEATRNMGLLVGGGKVRKIGFASIDRHVASVPRVPRFLHLAGASPTKGTERLLQTWRRHPEWPELRVIQSANATSSSGNEPANVRRQIGFVRSADEITHLLNQYNFHVCLSETEGWGHYIAEGLGCGAVVLSCDAPPMNELVRPGHGVLVAATASGTLNQATRYAFDEEALERAVARVLAMTEDEKEMLGRRARQWFLDNNAGFRERLRQALESVL